jgi:hypothetical protein
MDLDCACPAQMLGNAEGLVLDYPDQAFGGLCPFPDYQDFTLRDDAGAIPYHRDSAPTCYSAATLQGFYAERPLSGDVHWSYRILPRVLPEGYRSSPYYDFRAEPLGLNGSGMFSFILPVTTERIAMQLDWNLSEMPEDARGIWSYGEGKVHVDLTTWQIRLSLFNVGKMQAVEHGDFGVYWFSEPYFDARSVAERLYPIFQYMKDYFGDHESSFRVFLRRDPFEFSGGGSACAYAFISGYSAFGGMDEDKWFNVLIHEMTHTWPSMQDFHVGEGTWFTEGATEFYCTMLPYRAGLLDADFTVKCINEKIPGRYLNNVYREMLNDKLTEIQWKDRRAQTVPYGRGFLYLANTDFKMRTQGKGSIDDIVRKHNIMNQMTLREWKEFIQERLGDEGMQDFEDMCSGKLIEPLDGIFGDEIAMVKDEIELDGKPATTYHWEVRH